MTLKVYDGVLIWSEWLEAEALCLARKGEGIHRSFIYVCYVKNFVKFVVKIVLSAAPSISHATIFIITMLFVTHHLHWIFILNRYIRDFNFIPKDVHQHLPRWSPTLPHARGIGPTPYMDGAWRNPLLHFSRPTTAFPALHLASGLCLSLCFSLQIRIVANMGHSKKGITAQEK